MTQWINPDYLIPPDSELAQLLMQWSEDTDTRTWNIANLTNDLIAELEGGSVTRPDVYRAVAARCKGRKPNTIRRWAEVAADFDKDTQERYAVLSFDHFKTSRRLHSDGFTPSIDYGLQWCVEGNDDKLTAGKFHTVGQMLNQFVPELRDKKPLTRLWDNMKEKLYDQFLLVDNDWRRQELLVTWTRIDEHVLALDKDVEV
jgi:hypothetical protein